MVAVAIAVPFGQFLPGTTFVHRLDARTKLATVAALTVALFASDFWAGLLVCAAIVVAGYAISRLSWRLALRGLRPILVLLVFTLVANAVGRVDAGVPNLAGWGFDPQGLLRGLYFAFRIVLLIAATSLVTYTTSSVALTDGLVSLMRPLARVRLPIEDIAMMFSIAMRFIPTTAEEAEKIVVAQTARGARFDVGGPIRRAKAWIPVMVPLFVNLFRRADELAVAMESRCYTGEGRTRLRQSTMGPVDFGVVVGAALVAGVVSIWL